MNVNLTSGPRLEIGQELAPDTLQTFPARTPFMYMSIWLYVGRFPELPGLKETVAVPLLIDAETLEGAVGFEKTVGRLQEITVMLTDPLADGTCEGALTVCAVPEAEM